MNFLTAVSTGFANYATFSGRAIRSEYWYFVLFSVICNVLAGVIDAVVFHADIGVLGIIFALGTFIPSIAVLVRRLHDLDRSGWWWLIAFIPLIGAIILIVFACTRGSFGPNRFGPDTTPA